MIKLIGVYIMLIALYACSGETMSKGVNNNVYQIIDSWMDNDSIIKIVTLVENDGLLHIEIQQRDGHGRFLDVVKNKMNGLIRYDFDNDKGEYFIIEKNGNFAFYDSIGKVREIKLYEHL